MIQTTRWTTDTCGCVVRYSWDDAVKQENRVHTVAGFDHKCQFHAGLDDAAAYAAVTDENPRKNKALAAIADAAAVAADTSLFDGNGAFLGSWEFDADRKLKVSLPEATKIDPAVLETALKASISDDIAVEKVDPGVVAVKP